MIEDKTACTDVEILLDAYHDGELVHSEKELVEKHLGTCTRCQSSFSDIKRVVASLKSLPPVCLKRDMASEIELLVARRQKFKVVTPVFWGSLAAAAAAVVMLVVLRVWSPVAKVPYITDAPAVSGSRKPATGVVAQAPSSVSERIKSKEHLHVPLIPKPGATSSVGGVHDQQSSLSKPDLVPQLAETSAPESTDSDSLALGSSTMAYLVGSEQTSISEVLGLETDEDGLYAIKM